jgi:hypothetical protein
MPLQAGGPLQSLLNFALKRPMFQRGEQSRAAANLPIVRDIGVWPGYVHSFQKPREIARHLDIRASLVISIQSLTTCDAIQRRHHVHRDSARRRWTQLENSRSDPADSVQRDNLFSAGSAVFQVLGGNQTRHELPA